ncbi:MAG: hypothetical protein RHS_5584 [Robinsoniella sp. RHS]|uniref:plasmid recombination protein n=1 Tax=Robinsoniella sp. RHS TaxID=1504536 RepID=UPI00064B70F5|nr:MAG: hypothetical protein RHS_5584 [Robinsoniella sp. RHS]
MVGKGSVNHNSRKFHAKNTDPERSNLNIEYCNKNIKDVYHQLFDEALTRYNAKQTRSDRQIKDYYEKILAGKQEKLFHEIILQVGNKDDMSAQMESGQLAAEVLDEYMREFQKRNPTLRVFSAHLHMDEATPHLHIDFILFTTGSKRGLDTRVSLKQALAAMGFKGGTRSETEWNQWGEVEKEVLAAVMQEHGIEWEKRNTHEKHLSVLDFEKKERAKEVAELEQEIDGLEEKSAGLTEKIEAGRENIDLLEKDRQEAEKAAEEAKKQAEQVEKQKHIYKREWEMLKPVMEDVARELEGFRGRVEDMLPPSKAFESAASYRENKAKPLFVQMKNKIAALAAKLSETIRELTRIRADYRKLKAEHNLLVSGCDDLKAENARLKTVSTMFDRVVRIFGEEKVFTAVRQDESREQQEAERKQREQLEKEMSISKRLERAKQHVKARENGQPKKKPKSKGMER